MIRALRQADIPAFEQFCEGSPFGCKIAGLQRAYGLSLPFAGFWVQTDKAGNISATVSLLDGVAVTDCRTQADLRELKTFLPAIGSRTLLCDEQTSLSLYGKADRAGEILSRSASFRADLQAIQLLWEVPVRDLFLLLCESGQLQPQQFEPFYLDLSHRVRHGACLTQGAAENGRLAACAVAASITDKTAVLSAVAAHPEFRRRGFGSAAVFSLLHRLSPRTVFVLCATQSAVRFYESMGFSAAGRWAEIDL